MLFVIVVNKSCTFFLKKMKRIGLYQSKIDYGSTWNQLSESLVCILQSEQIMTTIPKFEFEVLYELVYTLCVCPAFHISIEEWNANPYNTIQILPSQNASSPIFPPNPSFLYYKFELLIKQLIIPFWRHRISSLASFMTSWNNFWFAVDYVERIFYFLHKEFISNSINVVQSFSFKMRPSEMLPHLQQHQIKEIKHLIFSIWVNEILFPLKEEFATTIVQWLQLDRTNSLFFYETAIREYGHCLILVGNVIQKNDLYEICLEMEVLEKSQQYFKEKSTLLQFYCINNTMLYMEKVEELFEMEMKRVTLCFFKEKRQKVTKLFVLEFINNKLEYLLLFPQKEEMFHYWKVFYRLVCNKSTVALHALQKALQEWLIEQSTLLIREWKLLKSFEMIELLIKHLQSISSYLMESELQIVKRNVFKTVLNTQIDNMAQLVAQYCHFLLVKANGQEEETMESILDFIIKEVFPLLDDGDVFLKFYSIFLGKRVVLQFSNSMQLEWSVLSKMKQVTSFDQIYKLERMCKDVSTSSTILDSFVEEFHPSLDTSLLILTLGTWPSQFYSKEEGEVQVPKEMQLWKQQFDAFFNRKFQGKKLSWLPQHFKFHVRASFTKDFRVYELIVNAKQLQVLEYLNEHDTIHSTEHPAWTEEIETLIKEKLIQRTGEVNVDFQSRHRKIQLFSVRKKVETKADTEMESKLLEQVEKERKYSIQACIIRVMKARKAMHHSELIAEVLKNLALLSNSHFKIQNVGDIKKNIDILMEQEYLGRDESNSSIYTYIA